MNRNIVQILKIIVATGLVIYLFLDDSLDFSQLNILLEQTLIAIMVVSFWCLGPFILVSLRCFLLLKALSYRTTWIQAFKLQLTGFFFNTSILGAVCGELIKVMYVIRDNKKLGKTSALISFLVDHIIGIQSIFVVGVITAFLNIKFILNNPKLVVINGLILALVVTILILFIVSLYHYKDDRDP